MIKLTNNDLTVKLAYEDALEGSKEATVTVKNCTHPDTWLIGQAIELILYLVPYYTNTHTHDIKSKMKINNNPILQTFWDGLQSFHKNVLYIDGMSNTRSEMSP